MTEDELLGLEGLQDPDIDDATQYKWDVEFQKHIASMILVDSQFCIQSIDLIKPTYFVDKAHRKAVEIVFDLRQKYKFHPKKSFVFQRVKEDFAEDKALLAHLAEINALYEYFEPGLEAREYLLDKITFFAKIQAIKQAFHACLKMIDKAPEEEETWQKVSDKLRTALNTDRNFDSGLDYFATTRERYDRMNSDEANDEIFVTGFKSVDESIKGGGYRKGEILSVIASSGVGKSNFLTCMAAINALRGKKVVYITLELSEDRVAERFDSILTGTSIKRLYDDREEVFASLDSAIEDKECKNPIIIKFWPGKSIQVDTIRAYLTQLKFHGYVPDMVVVDYVGEMKEYVGIPIHESRAKTVGELRGLANEGDRFFCATAMQPNRKATEVQKTGRIEADHIGASWDQINPLDGAISLNQNDGEKKVNMGRGHVMKQRSGKSGFDFYIHFNPDTLKISEVSVSSWKTKMTGHVNKTADEVAQDLIVGISPDEAVAAFGGHPIDKVATSWGPSSEDDIISTGEEND